jgi:1-acyl-sn-glycerol-3-phosphate acyltransferase
VTDRSERTPVEEPSRGVAPRTTGAPREADLVELREALDELRRVVREHLRPHPDETGLEEESAQPQTGERPDWMELFDELRGRISAFGMVERSGEVDDFGMDELLLRRAEPLFDFLQRRYWRVETVGLENLPAAGACLLVANRSGLLPYDGVMLSHVLAKQRRDQARARFLVADWLLTLPFAQAYLARVGGVRACRENAERLLRSGRSVIAFPEGAKGAAKIFRERYRLQRFGRGGIVRTALATRAPLVPIGVVGAEEAHPILFKVENLARIVGLPFVPVTPTFPALGPLGLLPLPTKWMIRIGEPIALDHLEPEAAEDELLVSRLNEDLRSRIQSMVDEGVRARDSVWG